LCGFAGIYKKGGICDTDRISAEKMSETICHRGPDEDKKTTSEKLILAFRRLSIIDLEGGTQPFELNDRFMGVFNGEIYNYRELRKELLNDGVTFSTNSEIEVILNLFAKEGPSFINKLRGMFALAFYDKQEDKLMLGRDPFGIKPLYYRISDEGVVFGSEMKIFNSLEGFEGYKIDTKLLQHYFSYQFAPGLKTLGGIDLLPSGSYMFFDNKTGKHETVKYFDPMFTPVKKNEKSFESRAAELRSVLEESVKYHMISDVPVGTFLSSGVDSAIITALSAKLSPGLKAYTVAFGVKEYSEIDDASKIAQHIDVEHIKLVAGVEDFKEAFPKVVYHLDSPVADPSTVAIYLICREAAKDLKVVLSGEGADELFGGYRIYDEQRWSRRIYALPGFIKGLLARLAEALPENAKGKNLIMRGVTPLEKRYIGNAFIFTEEEKKKFLKTYSPDVHFSDVTKDIYERAKAHSLSPMATMQYVDMNTWIRSDILVKGDRLSMAHALEVRVPFLDKEVFKFASTLADEEKLRKGTTKYILRYAFRDIIDEETFMRPKLGYPVPVRKWLKNELYDWAKEIIENSPVDDYIVKSEVLKMLDDHRDGTKDNYRKLWTILVFCEWYKQYMAK